MGRVELDRVNILSGTLQGMDLATTLLDALDDLLLDQRVDEVTRARRLAELHAKWRSPAQHKPRRQEDSRCRRAAVCCVDGNITPQGCQGHVQPAGKSSARTQ